MQSAAPLCLLLSAHPEFPTLQELVRVSRVAKGYYLLTESALLCWRALRVVVAKNISSLGVRPIGALSAASCRTHAWVFSRLTLYKHFIAPGEGPWPMVILEEDSGSEETHVSNEEDDWI